MDPTSHSAVGEMLSQKNRLHRSWANREVCATGDNHRCNSCTSSRQMEFLGEICMHFQGGLESLNKPVVWAFPKVVVCLDCGSAQFAVPETELKLIQENLGDAGLEAVS